MSTKTITIKECEQRRLFFIYTRAGFSVEGGKFLKDDTVLSGRLSVDSASPQKMTFWRERVSWYIQLLDVGHMNFLTSTTVLLKEEEFIDQN